MRAVTRRVRQLSGQAGAEPKLLVGKPGLDGHSNGAEQVAVARGTGLEVVYEGIRLTPEQIAESALQEGVHAVGSVHPERLAPAAGAGGASTA